MTYLTQEKLNALFEAMKKHKELTEKLYDVILSLSSRYEMNDFEKHKINEAATDFKSMNYYVKKYELNK